MAEEEPLTADDLVKMVADYRSGLNVKEIAEVYGIHFSTVYRLLKRMGIDTTKKKVGRYAAPDAIEEAKRRLEKGSE